MSEIGLPSVRDARGRFFGEGKLPADEVGQPILRSWLRCTELGLDQARPPHVEPLDGGELHRLCQRHERLRRLCRAELDALNSEAHDTGGIVILTNAQGTVLDTVGDVAFAGRAAEVALRPGVGWSEWSVGTNAIGTALAERRPVAVHGPEHFFESHQILSCAAVPITDPRGVIVGVLDFSGHANVRHVHALGLVRLAVEQIEHRFFNLGFDGCSVLRFHTDPAVLGAAREGILVFDAARRLIAANRRALSFFRRDWSALDATRIDELFTDAPEAMPRAAELRAADGGRFFGIVTPPADRATRPWLDELGGVATSVDAPVREAQTLDDAELLAMRAALGEAGGNVSRAARRLGIHRSTLYRRVLAPERSGSSGAPR
jgi:transcriptional regulator of acetoin/glycerol metabolism